MHTSQTSATLVPFLKNAGLLPLQVWVTRHVKANRPTDGWALWGCVMRIFVATNSPTAPGYLYVVWMNLARRVCSVGLRSLSSLHDPLPEPNNRKNAPLDAIASSGHASAQ